MTAAEHRIIIEKGADFKITLRVTKDGINAVDLSSDGAAANWSYTFSLRKIVDGELVDVTGFPMTNELISAGTPDPLANGVFQIVIDKAITGALPTLVTSDDPFATEYNYYYAIDINEVSGGTKDLRLLRGRCSVRA